MALKKFYKQTVHRIAAPGLKDLNFLADQISISRDDAKKILDDFFCDSSDKENAEEMRSRAWQHVLKGISVTIENVCITYK